MQKIKHKQIAIPPLLQTIPDAPQQLFMIGANLGELLAKPRIAIVGARNITPYGQAVTQKLSADLAQKGTIIVSGLAYGVDACAHTAALEAGGLCIAVLGNGLDRIYPSANIRLGERLVKQGGVIISEYPAGTPPYKNHFLERNRLVAGLADAVLITEAAERSGTLNTAMHALNQGKQVFVVPGNITSSLSAGTNNLLKAGASPVTEASDVLSALGIPNTAQTVMPPADNEQEFILLCLIKDGVSDGAELLHKSELGILVFNQTLTMLEISAKIKPLGANKWALS